MPEQPHPADAHATSAEATIVETVEVTKIYQQEKVPVKALDAVSITLEPGEFTALAGPSGSGKTTLLNMIGGLDQPTSGRVVVDGNDLGTMDRNELAAFRLKHIGFIFQAYNLIPVLSALENAEFILQLQGVPAAERKERVVQELEDLGIGRELVDRRPAELSGGQQQRVAVARALVARPKLILADEPTANLDSTTGARLLDKMREMNEKTGVTFLFSSHDPLVIERARRLLRMRDGRIESDERRE